jgi:DNA (cytosine-5)-methyltransferase 1
MMLRVLDLFSGIGGFSLGLERTGGFKTVAFCEIEPFPRKILAKHWPEVPCYHDVRELTADRLAADGIGVDVICGGFPCQDISVAGKGAGLAGNRSGLWSEFARLIGEIRPRYAIVENVSALLSRGLADVLGDLAALGYDAEWHCIPASAVGAPHRRDRIWIVAHARGEQHEGDSDAERWAPSTELFTAHAVSGELRHESGRRNGAGWSSEAIAPDDGKQGIVANASGPGLSNSLAWRIQQELAMPTSDSWWRTEPKVGRVAHGVPSRVDRLKGLGNAVVPQIPELIGRTILAAGT